METNIILCGDAAQTLQTLPPESVNCCITSPPYYGLRDYGVDGQIGREASPEAYIARLVEAFHEVRRVLQNDGALWVVIGDTYAVSGRGASMAGRAKYAPASAEVKPKDLLGIPWLLALALRRQGWYLRSAIIWHKPGALPENCRDRPTRSYEYVLLLSKSYHYYYDQEAVKVPVAAGTKARMKRAVSASHKYAGATPGQPPQTFNKPRPNRAGDESPLPDTRNLRDVWTVSAKPYRCGAHFAMFPIELITPCIQAGCPPGGVVLDPFVGSGTTCAAAATLGRRYIGIDISPEYCRIAEERLQGAAVG